MLIFILVILIALWFFGYVPIGEIQIPNPVLLSINNYQVTLWNVLILLAIAWAISVLPRPLQVVASVLLLFWILSVLGVLAISGLSNILLIGMIIGLGVYIVQGAMVKR